MSHEDNGNFYKISLDLKPGEPFKNSNTQIFIYFIFLFCMCLLTGPLLSRCSLLPSSLVITT